MFVSKLLLNVGRIPSHPLTLRRKKMVNFVCEILGVSVPLSGTTEYYIVFVFSCAIVLSFAVALIRFLLAPIDIASRLKR